MQPLTEHIIEQKHKLPNEAETLKIKKQVEKDKLHKVEQQTKDVLQEALEEMPGKGSSSWLLIIPLKEMGFTLNKVANWELSWLDTLGRKATTTGASKKHY